MIVAVLISIVVGVAVIWRLTKSLGKISTRERHRLFKLFAVSYVAIVLFGLSAWLTKKPKDKSSLSGFINEFEGPLLSYAFFKTVLVGVVYGLVFGIIDNVGLWFGMDALDPIIKGGPLTKAGIGNAYADSLSAILATFSGKAMSNFTGIEDTPLWANAAGTGLGCITGVVICRAISNRT